MAKTAKSPAKARPKPKPVRSPKKKSISSEFIDAEAEEGEGEDSDDGVLINHVVAKKVVRPVSEEEKASEKASEFEEDAQPVTTPIKSTRSRRPIIRSASPDINRTAQISVRSQKNAPKLSSQDPKDIEDHEPSASSSSKNTKKRVIISEVVIEVPSSDEDLEAMDIDDSVFKKPASIKSSAVPPLTTHSAASKRRTASEDTSAVTHKKKKLSTGIRLLLDMDDKTSKAVRDWMAAFMKDHANKVASTATNSEMIEVEAVRVDHDAIALENGIKASLESSLKIHERSDVNGSLRELSPDWDPPYAGDLLEDIGPQTPLKKSTPSEGKGKKKAVDFMPAVVKSARKSTVKSSRSTSGSSKTNVDGNVSAFMTPSIAPIATATGKSASNLTMAQFLRLSRGESADAEEDADAKDKSPPPEVDTIFMEDIENYKTYFDPKAPCGVFDLELQDGSLKPHYIGLPPLPALRRILAAYDPGRNSSEVLDYATGGRIKFSSWFNQNPRMLATNSMGAMLFTEAAPNFINLSRVSPLRLSSQVSVGSSTTMRLHFDERIAISPRKIGVKSERQRKWISGVLHDQDWERLESIVCLVFRETVMYGQINDKALSFQTMISPDPSKAQEGPGDRMTRSIPSHMFSTRSPGKKTTPSKTLSTVTRTKTLLACDDTVSSAVPIYDARKTAVNFDADLGRLGQVLPLFPGEVPSGSFTVVGYTCSSYKGVISGGSERVANLGCNILWVIVCGTPSLNSSRS
ncbi:hypothetical protein DFH07DRAFT_940365 [Mycena maculata]|uniref:Uncharacterized protein n=1 Tax=Mycena maculata TaxID=230809 RepID=A0AAD7NF09_9AGAR|nr:hypothetical protein DFH07DRAFT_940365 [Mycena maculata]